MGNLVPFVGMVGVILAQVSTMVVVKAAMSKGTNKYVIAVYSNGLSSLFLLILCLFRFNRSDRPRLTLSILGRFFMLAFISVTCQMTGYIGINYSSPTLATAMLNLVPAFTFILAILFRMETVDWRSKSSQAKSLGAVVSIVGAFVVTFYKGPQITMAPTRTISTPLFSPSPQHNWILGGFFLVCYAFEVSTWYIYQNSVIKHFPAVMITVFFSNLFATVLSAAFSLIAVKDFGAWRVKLDIGLVAIMYSSIGYFNRLLISLLSPHSFGRIGFFSHLLYVIRYIHTMVLFSPLYKLFYVCGVYQRLDLFTVLCSSHWPSYLLLSWMSYFYNILYILEV